MDHHTQDGQQAATSAPLGRDPLGATELVTEMSSSVVLSSRSAVTFAAAQRAVPACDLVCLSHLRWDLVFQRPHHLLTRAARDRRVYFVEEPLFGSGPLGYDVELRQAGVRRVVFRLPVGLDEAAAIEAQRELIDTLFAEERVGDCVLWYYTPMALPFTRHLAPRAIVYDCMDELSAFAGAPPALREREAELLTRADLVFTGGQSLFEAKRGAHPSIYPFPSSVDVAHFARARAPQADPPDQAALPHPRIGFFGVIDERMDLELVRGVAAARPDWQLVFLGPVVKIPVDVLPQAPNIHYPGPKAYDDLPAYLAGWDVAILPFARNESTRFISPTKTPEYLAAGCPVVSTSIRDVVRPYGQQGLVRIADTAPDFVSAIDASLADDPTERRVKADAFLSRMSWDGTWAHMRRLLDSVLGVTPADPPFAGGADPPPA